MTPKAISRIKANMSSYEYQKIKHCSYGTNGKRNLLPEDRIFMGITLLVIGIISIGLCWLIF